MPFRRTKRVYNPDGSYFSEPITQEVRMSHTIRPGTREGFVEIVFDGKPSDDIIKALKAAKFRFTSSGGEPRWYGKEDAMPAALKTTPAAAAPAPVTRKDGACPSYPKPTPPPPTAKPGQKKYKSRKEVNAVAYAMGYREWFTGTEWCKIDPEAPDHPGSAPREYWITEDEKVPHLANLRMFDEKMGTSFGWPIRKQQVDQNPDGSETLTAPDGVKIRITPAKKAKPAKTSAIAHLDTLDFDPAQALTKNWCDPAVPYITDGRTLLIRKMVTDVQFLTSLEREQGKDIPGKSVRIVIDKATEEAVSIARIGGWISGSELNINEPIGFLYTDDVAVPANAQRIKQILALTGADVVKISKPNRAVVFFKGNELAAILMPFTVNKEFQLSLVLKRLKEFEAAQAPKSQPVEVKAPELTLADANKALKTLSGFIGGDQLKVVRSGLKGEESQFFIDKMVELAGVVEKMPKVYGQEKLGDQAIVYLHYFKNSFDWYITEKDSETFQLQAFGLACMHEDEMGYINLVELTKNNVELDFHWKPKTLAEIRKERNPEEPGPHAPSPDPEPAPPEQPKPNSWKIGVKTSSSATKWGENAMRYSTREAAQKAGEDLASRWMAVTEWTVLESEDMPNDVKPEKVEAPAPNITPITDGMSMRERIARLRQRFAAV